MDKFGKKLFLSSSFTSAGVSFVADQTNLFDPNLESPDIASQLSSSSRANQSLGYLAKHLTPAFISFQATYKTTNKECFL